MDLQPHLENELLLLRPLRRENFADLYAVAKDPLIWEQHPCPKRYEAEEFAAFFREALAAEATLVIVDKKEARVIGSTRFKRVAGAADAVEIGWSFLARDKWGGVYNRAMKELMIDYAFGFVDNVVFYVAPDNLRSQKAVRKIGGQRVTGPPFTHLLRSEGRDWTYRIGKADWQGRKEV